nr:flavodoxin [Harryflintia acetispora]
MIAYFSKTGTTEAVAQQIQGLVGGDLVKIETATPYPEDYTETTEVAKKESEDDARPPLSTSVSNMDEYDTIYIGYPIWWHTAPMAVYTFLESYDLSGKTVIPFCTSGGSEIDESMAAINALCASATVLEGLTANDSDDVQPWLTKIGALE